MMKFLLATSLLVLAAAVAPASAQQLPPVLTLDEAIRIARENSPVYQRTTNDVEVASNAVRSAWAGFIPTLSMSAGTGLGLSRRTVAEDEFGEVVQRPTTSTSRSSSANQGISAGVTLFDGGATYRSLQAQRAQYEGTVAQVEGAAIQLDANVSRAFFTAVKAVRDITLEEQLLASARERLQHTEQLMALAARTRIDVLGAEEDVLSAEQNLERVRGAADKARLALSVVLGIEPQPTMTLDTVTPPVFDPADLAVERLVAQALANSPTVRQRRAALNAAGHRSSAERSRRWPSLSVSGSYSRSGSAVGFGGFGEFDVPNSGMSFSMGLSYPLFDRFQRSNAVGNAEAAEQDASYDLRLEQLTVAQNVRSGIIDLTNAYRALQMADERADISRERLELAVQQYESGGSTFTELQSVIDRTAQAERQAIDARFEFYQARINLEATLGSRLER